MNDVRPVSSQNTTSWIRLPDSTVPSIAPMNAMRNEKKRGTGSCGRHVVARVQHDERADERDEHREQPCVAVHAQVEVEAELRQPRQAARARRRHRRRRGYWHRDEHRASDGDDAGEPRLGVARVGRQEGAHRAAEERQKDDQREEHTAPSRDPVSLWASVGIDRLDRAGSRPRLFGMTSELTRKTAASGRWHVTCLFLLGSQRQVFAAR